MHFNSRMNRAGVSRAERGAFYSLAKYGPNRRNLEILSKAQWLPENLRRVADRQLSAVMSAETERHLREMEAYLAERGAEFERVSK